MVDDIHFPNYDEYTKFQIKNFIEQLRRVPTPREIAVMKIKSLQQMGPASFYVSPFTGNVHIGGVGPLVTPENAVSDLSHETLHTVGNQIREPSTGGNLDNLFSQYYTKGEVEDTSGIPKQLIQRLEDDTPQAIAIDKAIRAQLSMRRGY